jgi:hypothetical protein
LATELPLLACRGHVGMGATDSSDANRASKPLFETQATMSCGIDRLDDMECFASWRIRR